MTNYVVKKIKRGKDLRENDVVLMKSEERYKIDRPPSRAPI